MRKFDAERLFLFTHSYSGKVIAQQIIRRCKNDPKRLAKEINLLAKVLRFRHEDMEAFVLNPSDIGEVPENLQPELQIFLNIESELGSIAIEKLDEYSTARDDYQRQMLSPAIERAVGNDLADIDNDREFEVKTEAKIQEYTRAYYRIAGKYRLPTMRIVPFLLRLICV